MKRFYNRLNVQEKFKRSVSNIVYNYMGRLVLLFVELYVQVMGLNQRSLLKKNKKMF